MNRKNVSIKRKGTLVMPYDNVKEMYPAVCA
jgi:hypothetical protein